MLTLVGCVVCLFGGGFLGFKYGGYVEKKAQAVAAAAVAVKKA